MKDVRNWRLLLFYNPSKGRSSLTLYHTNALLPFQLIKIIEIIVANIIVADSLQTIRKAAIATFLCVYPCFTV